MFKGEKMRNTHYIGLRLSEKDREILEKIDIALGAFAGEENRAAYSNI